MTDKTPAFKLKDRGLIVTVWKNATEEGKTYYNTTLIKRYKDGEEWKDTSSLSEGDLLRSSRLLAKAYDKISELRNEQ